MSFLVRFASLFARSARPRSLQAVACVLLCAMGVGSVGMPVYRPVIKDASQPFPCQDHACGCADAESCWRSCCCHTNAEKVAWARKHGVTPPSYVIAAAAAESRSQVCTTTCCSRGGCGTKQRAAVAPPRGRLSVVVMSNYLKCRGLSAFWTVLSQALIGPAERPSWPLPPSGEWVAERSPAVRSVSLAPEPPPPRAAL